MPRGAASSCAARPASPLHCVGPGDDALARACGALAQIAPHCLAQQRIECRVCGDACGTGAIRFAPRLGGVALPAVDVQRCNGCGDCVAPCPVQAITLLARHAEAECAAR